MVSPIPALDGTRENLLLAVLTVRERRHLMASGRQVELGVNTVLCEPGERMRHVFFPTRGFLSLTMPVAGHSKMAVGMIGDEGMLGIWSMLGMGISPLHAEVLSEVMAWRYEAKDFWNMVKGSSATRRRLNLYLYVLLTQRTQAAICANFHVLEARLATRILVTRDRVHSDDFHLTHEYMAGVLGVRRSGVTRAAMALSEQNLIRYSRGDIHVIDGKGLEAAACGCYMTDRDTYSGAMS